MAHRIVGFTLIAVAVTMTPTVPVAAGSVSVVVFEGRGLGHGIGLPLDGANQLAAGEDLDSGAILDRFFPGTAEGDGGGLIRVEVGGTENLAEGVTVTLPGGGVVRDGRRTAVAPSFPINVPADTPLNLSFDADFYRAEVTIDGSSTGTVEVDPSGEDPTGSTEPRAGGDDEEGSPEAEVTTTTFPPLAASPHSLWIEPRAEGEIVIDQGGRERRVRGLVEVLVEAERLHLVNELDVEEYLLGIDFDLPEGFDLEAPALEAAVVAARTYAVRAASAEPKVGRFHLHSDSRSIVYGARRSPQLASAVEATAGRIRVVDGLPIAALITVGAGGVTARPTEVFGTDAGDRGYLDVVEYETGRAFRWQVEMNLSDVATRLGYQGEPENVAIADRSPSGRPATLRVTGSSDPLDADAPTVHRQLRLPSTAFEVSVEERDQPVAARDPSPPFQQLPGEPIADQPPGPAGASGDEGEETDGGRDLPTVLALAAVGAFALAALVLLVANVQRRVRLRRERRASTSRHPSTQRRRPPERKRPGEDRVPRPTPDRPRRLPGEPDWLEDLLPDQAEPAVEPGEGTAPEETDDTRPLSEILGWNDAPEWLDEPEDPGEQDTRSD